MTILIINLLILKIDFVFHLCYYAIMENKLKNSIIKIKNDIITFYPILIALILYFIIMQLVFGDVCIIKVLFHIDCPGCGITRASYYLLTGQLNKAIESNYTVFFWLTLIPLFIIHRYIHNLKKVFPVFLVFVCCITLMRYFINIIIYFS